MQLQVMNSPFKEKQVELLNQLLPNLSEVQCVWLSGYLAAIPKTKNGTQSGVILDEPPLPTSGSQSSVTEVTVLYGSQTGNCQELAESMSDQLKEQGYKVNLTCMSSFKPNSLKKIKYLFIIVSTHGEGDPPDNALTFYEYLFGRRAPKLDEMKYSVLALGDSSYEQFCQTGKEIDERLSELGAARLGSRVDCDLDFDEPAEEWFEQVFGTLKEQANQNRPASISFLTKAPTKVETKYSRKNPFPAEVLENINLNGQGSNKETRHLELLIEGSDLQFEPGDSIGIFPQNDPQLVTALISEMEWDPEEIIDVRKEGEHSLKDALLNKLEITVLTKSLLQKANELVTNEKLADFLTQKKDEVLKEYITTHDLLDFVRDFSLQDVSASEFIPILRKMPARLYSISSSYQANPDEVHLTIGAVRYHAGGRERNGVCSVQCAERIEVGDTVNIYVHRNPNFKLPENPDTPIIMIGPGTGVAPYRSFLEEREEIGAQGKTWLFFGDQHYVTDFLYQIEWQRWLKEDVLTRLDVAFSRDTAEKVYVQHRMLEQSKELFNWLEEGATVFVCGDEKSMAKDVHQTLLSIIEREGNLSSEEASEYLADMQKNKRYQRDVY